MGQTPVLDQFLGSLQELVQKRDGAKVQDFLQLEPPLSEVYQLMVNELQQNYAPGARAETELLQRCEPLVPRSKGGSWTAFPTFVKLYLIFLRDMNTDNLLETYNQLKTLLNQCVLALGDSQMGVVVLPTVLYLSKVLAKLAMGLDRRPDLIAHIRRMEGLEAQDESVEKVTLVEKSANVVREAFIKCLTDRTGTPGPHGKPEGKRIGIYLMANLCLKLLFQCGKLRNAEQMFASISAQSPPLAYFPASQRVTYLYYLGRYLFANNLFFPAAIALQAAYDQCHRQAISQRHLILSYLIPCNIILGRFPSQALLQRPEAQGLAAHFQPLCRLIVRGDYLAFRQHLFFGSPTAEWFARKGILFTLRNRCEILVWRSFARKVFMYGGSWGGPQAQAQKGPPPVLNLKKLVVATRWLQAQHASPGNAPATANLYGSQLVFEPTDPDYARLEGANGRTSPATDQEILEKYGDYLAPDGFYTEEGRSQPNQPGHLVDGDPEDDYDDYELDPYAYDIDDRTPDSSMMQEIESIFASLISQGLMGGYLLHREPRFAVPGAKIKGILPTGFPNVWQTISAREGQDSSVPGWVQPRAPAVGAAGGGRVVNLAGARPVGVQ
ncbi:PCI/PINT associated module [Penicillium coprophilum]|uniref:PCI/PINT associated module n=1 Tax=Penicillium coprophilum TaxID=36646 RepID=UPI0023A31C81|nr:PCI/PINT associated module [Penicillium coprophilum]KAJ5169981.1 PCI/PINT associated module [Penicillium coprophilum]